MMPSVSAIKTNPTPILVALALCSELALVLWTMVLNMAVQRFAVGSIGLGVITLFVLWAFWAGEHRVMGERGRRRDFSRVMSERGRRRDFSRVVSEKRKDFSRVVSERGRRRDFG